jgi:hypothetical protein
VQAQLAEVLAGQIHILFQQASLKAVAVAAVVIMPIQVILQ